MSQPDFPGSALRRCTRRWTCSRPTTRSWSARVARDHQRRCYWRGRGTACSWSTERRFQATPCRPMWCNRVRLPPSHGGGCSIGSPQPDVRQFIPTRSTSVPSCWPEPGDDRKPPCLLPETDRPGQTARRRRRRSRCGRPRGLHCRGATDGRRTGRGCKRSFEGRHDNPRTRAGRRRGRRSVLDRRRSGPARTVPTSTRRYSRSTTRIGAICRWTAGSRRTSAPGDLPRRRPTTA